MGWQNRPATLTETSLMPSTTTPLTWNDTLLLGDPEMDAVHEEFVTWIARLTTAEAPEVADVLAALESHAISHFGMEDTWMRETDFPPRQCHADEHAAVLLSIAGVRERVAGGDVSPAYDLAQALADWFPAHADYLDSALAHWMCKRRWGGKPVVVRRDIFGDAATAIHKVPE
jgi:hemerythrin-like metal-binding protein